MKVAYLRITAASLILASACAFAGQLVDKSWGVEKCQEYGQKAPKIQCGPTRGPNRGETAKSHVHGCAQGPKRVKHNQNAC